MGNSFNNVWLHYVWATKYRVPVLAKEWRYRLYAEMKDFADARGIHLDYVNGVEDHIHLLVKLETTQTISFVAKELKGASSRWLNIKELTEDLFYWQIGYGVVSVSPYRIVHTRNYIKHQEERHKRLSYEEEIKRFTLYMDA